MTNNKDNQKTFIVKKVAEKMGVSVSYVYMCLRGDRDNDEVCSLYDEMRTAVDGSIERLQDNALMSAVKQLVL